MKIRIMRKKTIVEEPVQTLDGWQMMKFVKTKKGLRRLKARKFKPRSKEAIKKNPERKHFTLFVKENPRFVRVFNRLPKMNEGKLYWFFRIVERLFTGANNYVDFSDTGSSVTWPIDEKDEVQWTGVGGEQDLTNVVFEQEPIHVEVKQALTPEQVEQTPAFLEAKQEPEVVENVENHPAELAGPDLASTLSYEAWREEQDLSGFEAVVEDVQNNTLDEAEPTDDNVADEAGPTDDNAADGGHNEDDANSFTTHGYDSDSTIPLPSLDWTPPSPSTLETEGLPGSHADEPDA